MRSLCFSASLRASTRRVLFRTLPAFAAANACACGLASNGLLDITDGASDDADGGDTIDAFVDDGQAAQDGAHSPVDAAIGPDSDASIVPVPLPDARAAESSTDGRLDGPIDAQAVPPTDGPADAPSEGPPSPPEGGSPADGSTTGPSPLVWDGGAIADPQFGDSAWLDFCASLSACGEFPSLSACLAHMPQPASPDALVPSPALIDAVNAAAPSCASVGTALGDGSACASATPDVCSGNSLVTCRWGFAMTIDCGGLGLVCSNGNGNAGCGFDDCGAAQEGATYCVGTNYVARCTSGRYVAALDCQTFGVTCSGATGAAQCRGMGRTTCSGATSCMGQTLGVCVGGAPLRADCSMLYDPNFSCVAGGGGAQCAADNACDPATFTDTCAGQGQVNVCNAGATTQYDCTVNWNGCRGGHCVP